MATEIGGDVTGGNVNINGTQIFNGAVYIVTNPPDQPPRPDPIPVFLSYARADDDPDYDDLTKSFMRRLYNRLTAAGFAVWWDRMSLPSRGETFTAEIETAIRGCQRFVLVVGPGAIASPYVQAEWEFALAECKPVTPILRAGDYPLIPPAVAEINAIDCRPSRDETVALTDLINRLRDDAPLGDPIGVKPLPPGYITRPEPFNAARDALCADAIRPTVISAPPSAVALYGLGGIGKSTLAAALAEDCQIRRHFPSGILWIEVGRTPNIADLQTSIGVHFGDSRDNYPNERDGALSLSRLLRDKAALILLDDVWEHQLVERFPVAGSACRLLITTRSSALAGRVAGEDIRLNLLTPAEGAHLMAARAGGNPADADYQQISTRLGGHTLAIALAAAQLASGYADDAADLLRLLDKRASGPQPFKDLAIDDKDKDLNLALSLAQSYDALPTDDLRRRFRQTAIFAPDSIFDRDALAAIWGDADADDARTPLQTLEGAGLLDAAAETGSYSLHPLLRAYAHALLDAENETEATFNRYADFVIEQAAQFDTLKPEDWGHLDPLLPHVDFVGAELVRRWNTTETPDEALAQRAENFVSQAYHYVYLRPRMIETTNGREGFGLKWLEMGLAASRQTGNQSRESLFLNQIALAWSALGEKRKALDYYEQALPLYQAVGDRSGEATTLNNIGKVWNDLGEKRKALDYYEQALPLRRAVGDRGGEATTLTNIGMAWSALGEKRKALDYYDQALPLFRAVGDRRGEATTLNNIGLAWDDLGEKRQALDFYEQALPLFRAVGDRGGEATTLNNIGLAWSALGEKRKALDYYEQALPMHREVGNRTMEATTLNNMAAIYFYAGELEKAVEIFQQIIEIFRAVGAVSEEASILVNTAVVYQRMGRIAEAIESAQAGRDILIRYNLPQAASGATIAQYDALLAELRGDDSAGS